MDLRGITCKLATFSDKYRFYSDDKSDNCIPVGSRLAGTGGAGGRE
jgi:hypothetical protein